MGAGLPQLGGGPSLEGELSLAHLPLPPQPKSGGSLCQERRVLRQRPVR